MARGLSSGPMPGTSATARSAKNRCRMARDSGVCRDPSLMARSTASPCSKGSSQAARTAAMSSSKVTTPLCILRRFGAQRRQLGFGQRRHRHVAYATRSLARGHQLRCIRDGCSAEVSFDDLVDQAQLLCLFGADRLAIHEHPQRLLRTDQSRQALRTHRARHDAEGDFRKAEFRGAIRNTVVPGQRDLHAAAQRGSMQRNHDRLRQGFELRQHVAQFRRRHHATELADVRAGHERAARAMQHHCLHILPAGKVAGDRQQAAADRRRNGVDRRAVDGDDGNAGFNGNTDGLGQFDTPEFGQKQCGYSLSHSPRQVTRWKRTMASLTRRSATPTKMPLFSHSWGPPTGASNCAAERK